MLELLHLKLLLEHLVTLPLALSKDASPGNNQHSEHHFLVNYMISALNDADNPMAELTKCIDPNLTHYHKDSVLKMALLSKDCVDENQNQHPDMSIVVLRLSQIFMSCEEWKNHQDSHTKF
ncbi:hypothetical protein SLEP1_g1679 [Rubroshorea leprosula]|uniref:Uncharacterized protein n=1 Tax=Rubroshorea leprosula TaxID=152421 RepID=A0AAV5HKA3_9ROSI|nr:hypothetical protein SLEP1_g1679 [Rubroshorea leprosula]